MSDGGPFEIRVFRTLQEVEHLRDIWASMQCFPEADIDFVSLLINTRPEIIRPHVLVVYSAGRPVSLIVGRLERGNFEIKIGYKVLWRSAVTRMVIFYEGFMGQTTPAVARLVIPHLLNSLAKEQADLLLWNGIRSGSDLHRLLRYLPNPLCRDVFAQPVQRWKMSLPLSLDEMLEERLGKKHRYWAKRTMRLLEKDFPGAVRFVRFSAPEEMERLFTDVLHIARKTYQWGLGVGFQDNAEQRSRLHFEAKKGWHRSYVLYLKEEPVAFWICIVYQGTVYSAYTGYDPKYRKYEIGTNLFLHMIGELCREDLKQLDFGLGSAFYKERFGDSQFAEATLCVFSLSVRGVLLNILRVLTEGPSVMARGFLEYLGLEQKLKRAWRTHITPAQVAREEPSQAQS